MDVINRLLSRFKSDRDNFDPNLGGDGQATAEPARIRLQTDTLLQSNDYYDGQIDHYYGQEIYFHEAKKEAS